MWVIITRKLSNFINWKIDIKITLLLFYHIHIFMNMRFFFLLSIIQSLSIINGFLRYYNFQNGLKLFEKFKNMHRFYRILPNLSYDGEETWEDGEIPWDFNNTNYNTTIYKHFILNHSQFGFLFT